VAAEFAYTLGNQTDPTTVGGVNLLLSHTITAALLPGPYKWDMQLTFPDGTVATYMAGNATVVAEVTR
jgi:hypothetical protein